MYNYLNEETDLNNLYNEIQTKSKNVNNNIKDIDNIVPDINNALKTGYTGPFLGKMIETPSGKVYYVTDRGVAKYYPTTASLAASSGNNGCPVDGTYTSVGGELNDKSIRSSYPYLSVGDDMTYTTTESGMNVGQSCGNAGYNVYVNEKSPIVTEYKGCVSGNEDYGATFENIGNGDELYTFDQCKDMAGSSGYAAFSLNLSSEYAMLTQGTNNASVMDLYSKTYGTTNEEIVKQMFSSPTTQGQCFASKQSPGSYSASSPYYYDTQNVSLSSCTSTNSTYSNNSTQGIFGLITSLFYTGKQYNFNSENGAKVALTSTTSGIWSLTDGGNVYAEWKSSDADNSCSYGGAINIDTLVATQGPNCTQGSYSNCNTDTGNNTEEVLNYLTKGDRSNYSNMDMITPTYPVWSNYENGKIVASADTCSPCGAKAFEISYQCGANTTTTSTGTPVADNGGMISFNCAENFWNCFGGLGINDDGEVKILKGIWGSNGVSQLFSLANTPSNLGTMVSSPLIQSYMKDVVKYGWGTQNYINSVDGKKYNILYNGIGMGPGQAVGILPSPSGKCFLEMALTGYLTINYVIASPSCDATTNTGVSNENMQDLFPGTLLSNGVDAASQYHGVNEIMSKAYLDNLGKKGFVDDNLVLHPYPDRMMPSYNSLNASITSGSSLGSTTNAPLSECRVECIGNSGCNFFNYTSGTNNYNGTCNYYSSIGDTGVGSDTNMGYYKTPPQETNTTGTCPFESTYNSIDTSEWNFYAKGEIMNPSTSCYTKNDNYLNSQIDLLDKENNNVKDELSRQTDFTTNYMNEWKNSSTEFFNKVPKNIKLYDEIKRMNGKSTTSYTNEYSLNNAEGFNTLLTINEMNNDSQELQKRNRYRNIFWTLLAITLVIMTMRLIQLYSK